MHKDVSLGHELNYEPGNWDVISPFWSRHGKHEIICNCSKCLLQGHFLACGGGRFGPGKWQAEAARPHYQESELK